MGLGLGGPAHYHWGRGCSLGRGRKLLVGWGVVLGRGAQLYKGVSVSFLVFYYWGATSPNPSFLGAEQQGLVLGAVPPNPPYPAELTIVCAVLGRG